MKKYIVAYSYQDKFEVDEAVANALIDAKLKGIAGVKDGDRFFSASYMWLLPKEETQLKELTAKQLIEAGNIAEWLTMPIHELGWNENTAIEYAKKLVLRVDLKELKKLDGWCGYRGTYPNAKKFLMEAKQLDDSLEMPDTPLLEGGSNENS